MQRQAHALRAVELVAHSSYVGSYAHEKLLWHDMKQGAGTTYVHPDFRRNWLGGGAEAAGMRAYLEARNEGMSRMAHALHLLLLRARDRLGLLGAAAPVVIGAEVPVQLLVCVRAHVR